MHHEEGFDLLPANIELSGVEMILFKVKTSQGDIPGQESIETLEEGKYMQESHIV